MSTSTPESGGKTPPKAAPAQSGPLMYLGPTRPYSLPIFGKTVFNAGLPEFCAAHKSKPHFMACFVPLAQAGKAMQDLRDPKSPLAKAAAAVYQETLKAAESKE